MLPKPSHCATCVGYQWFNCRGYSRVTGESRIPLLIVGEASGAEEEKKGEPFIGPSGRLLERVLKMSGLNRSDYAITNCIRCRPPNNVLKGAPYEREILDHCRYYLDKVVADLKPRMILALGDTALSELSVASGSVTELRGFITQSRYGIPMIAAYHPAYLLPRRDSAGAMHLLGVFQHDLRVAERFARNGVPQPLPTRYALSPTAADIDAYLNLLHADPTLPVAYDIETAAILGEKEGELLSSKRIVQIQFSSAVGEALVLPYQPPFIDIARHIMALPNPKWDYNGRLFDRPILRAHGFTINGECHDLMNAYAHLQPNFVSNKDDTHGDKGVPSKLMSLQSCVSFYYPTFKPWKHKKFPVWDKRWEGQRLSLPLRLYGGKDSDATFRIGVKLLGALRQSGLYEGYMKHKVALATVLDDLSNRGLPVDETLQTELREYIVTEEAKLDSELQSLVPLHLKPYKEYRGWPADLREVVKAAGLWAKRCRPEQFPEHVTLAGYAMLPFDVDESIEYRLCKPLPFNPDSSVQLLRYITHRGYRVPLHIDSGKPTTGKDSLDLLIQETDDAALKIVQQVRKLTKIRGTYTEGHWIPQADGCVHPEITFGTASGQLTSRKPNTAQYPQHGALAKMAKACIRAKSGYTLIKRDMRSFHARTLGWLSGDARYFKMSDYDVHSVITAFFLKLPIAPKLFEMDGIELRTALAEIKKAHKEVRDVKAKRAVLGLGFHMGVDKLYRMNPDAFDSPLDAQNLINLIQTLFPKAFKEYPATIEKQIQKSPKLVSPTGHQRWMWAMDLEQAVSYLPANIAHCHIFDSMLIMQERGLLDRWQLCNMIHDCLIFHCPNDLIGECIEVSKEIMERESDVLIDSPLGPFQCSSDVEMGESMAEMRCV